MRAYSIDTKHPKNSESPIRFYEEQMFTLGASCWKEPPLVLVTRKLINTPSKSTSDITQNTTAMETSPKSEKQNSPTLTSYVEGFHARLFPSQESEEASQILEELCSLTSPDSLRLKDLAYYSLKTLKGYSLTIKGALSPLSSVRLMSWGMTANGKCLTAKTSEFPRTESACSLSDILEEQPDPKYFLSDEAVTRLLKNISEASELRDSLNKPISQELTDNKIESTLPTE